MNWPDPIDQTKYSFLELVWIGNAKLRGWHESRFLLNVISLDENLINYKYTYFHFFRIYAQHVKKTHEIRNAHAGRRENPGWAKFWRMQLIYNDAKHETKETGRIDELKLKCLWIIKCFRLLSIK